MDNSGLPQDSEPNSSSSFDFQHALCSASYVSCQRDTARICCCAPCCRRAVQQSIDISSPPGATAVRRCCVRSMGQTDGRTYGRTLNRFIDSAPHTERAVSIHSVNLDRFLTITYDCFLQFIRFFSVVFKNLGCVPFMHMLTTF